MYIYIYIYIYIHIHTYTHISTYTCYIGLSNDWVSHPRYHITIISMNIIISSIRALSLLLLLLPN